MQLSKIIDSIYIKTFKKTALSAAVDPADKNDALELELISLAGDTASDVTDKILTSLKNQASVTSSQIQSKFQTFISSAKFFIQNTVAQIAVSAGLHYFKSTGTKYVKFVAVIDNRTSKQCRMLDGTVFKINDCKYTPPLHPHCRSNLEDIEGDYTGELYKDNTYDRTVLDEIDSFKNKYSISSEILNSDLVSRLKRLKISI